MMRGKLVLHLLLHNHIEHCNHWICLLLNYQKSDLYKLHRVMFKNAFSILLKFRHLLTLLCYRYTNTYTHTHTYIQTKTHTNILILFVVALLE